MKFPRVENKTALMFVIPLMLLMLAVGIYNWPKGKTSKELMEYNAKQDSIREAAKLIPNK